MERIFKAGASLYRVSANEQLNRNEVFYADSYEDFLEAQHIEETESHFRQFGPWRVKPGGLSVSFNNLKILIFLGLQNIWRYRE
jgi:hypothetical protein